MASKCIFLCIFIYCMYFWTKLTVCRVQNLSTLWIVFELCLTYIFLKSTLYIYIYSSSSLERKVFQWSIVLQPADLSFFFRQSPNGFFIPLIARGLRFTWSFTSHICREILFLCTHVSWCENITIILPLWLCDRHAGSSEKATAFTWNATEALWVLT